MEVTRQGRSLVATEEPLMKCDSGSRAGAAHGTCRGTTTVGAALFT